MYYKLNKLGIILNGIKPYVIHKHFFTLDSLLWTTKIYASSFGKLSKIYGYKLKGFFNGVILMNLFPIWGILKTFKLYFQYKKKFFLLLKINLIQNWTYLFNFTKGYMGVKE